MATCGEEKILALAARRFCAGTKPHASVLYGIGDDAAVLKPAPRGILELLTTDMIVAGTHFTARHKPEQIGWKAMAVNISDIAAMGGEPRHAVVSVSLPPRTPHAYIEGLMKGMQRAAAAFGVAIVGGDTVGGPVLAITVALTGHVAQRHVCYRHGAKPGDVLAVTGALGGSLRTGRHLAFTPRVAEARWLVHHAKPSAMMDLSDGLATDGLRMAKASRARLCLRAASTPRTAGSTLRDALCDGEDFELLCAFAPQTLTPRILRAYAAQFDQPLTIIGEVSAGTPCVLIDGKRTTHQGFDHFAVLD